MICRKEITLAKKGCQWAWWSGGQKVRIIILLPYRALLPNTFSVLFVNCTHYNQWQYLGALPLFGLKGLTKMGLASGVTFAKRGLVTSLAAWTKNSFSYFNRFQTPKRQDPRSNNLLHVIYTSDLTWVCPCFYRRHCTVQHMVVS